MSDVFSDELVDCRCCGQALPTKEMAYWLHTIQFVDPNPKRFFCGINCLSDWAFEQEMDQINFVDAAKPMDDRGLAFYDQAPDTPAPTPPIYRLNANDQAAPTRPARPFTMNEIAAIARQEQTLRQQLIQEEQREADRQWRRNTFIAPTTGTTTFIAPRTHAWNAGGNAQNFTIHDEELVEITGGDTPF